MLSVSSQRKYNFYHQNTLLDAFQTNSHNMIGRNPSMVIPLLANQDLTPMLDDMASSKIKCNVGSFYNKVDKLSCHERFNIVHNV